MPARSDGLFIPVGAGTHADASTQLTGPCYQSFRARLGLKFSDRLGPITLAAPTMLENDLDTGGKHCGHPAALMSHTGSCGAGSKSCEPAGSSPRSIPPQTARRECSGSPGRQARREIARSDFCRPVLGLRRRRRFARATSSGFISRCDRRPSHLPSRARLRSRAAFSLATRLAFSNCAMAPSTWRTRTAVGVSSMKKSGALAGMRSIPAL